MDILIPTPRARKPGKKSKKPDKRPARARYWAARVLEIRKVRNLMRCCGMSKQSAYKYWRSHRKGRVKEGYFRVMGRVTKGTL